jgi:hypothetical protein
MSLPGDRREPGEGRARAGAVTWAACGANAADEASNPGRIAVAGSLTLMEPHPCHIAVVQATAASHCGGCWRPVPFYTHGQKGPPWLRRWQEKGMGTVGRDRRSASR